MVGSARPPMMETIPRRRLMHAWKRAAPTDCGVERMPHCPSYRLGVDACASHRPRTWSRSGLEEAGYEGFLPFARLAGSFVTKEPGIYVVLRTVSSRPAFLTESPAAMATDQTRSPDFLAGEWVAGTDMLYIGKANWGSRRDGVWRRLKQYRRTGAGRSDSHLGGVWIWQVSDVDELLVCWKASDDRSDEAVRDLERCLIAGFASRYGRRPFANRVD